jgi:hypothetical protein
MCYMIGGLVSFLQSPLVALAHSMGAFWPIHLLMTLLFAALTAAISRYIYVYESKRKLKQTVAVVVSAAGEPPQLQESQPSQPTQPQPESDLP